jgi:cation transport regulator ChaC
VSLLRVFAYGSLVEEPSCPDQVREVRLARAPGLARRFHLRSRYRGCLARVARYPHLRVADFVDADFHDSLVLGTRPARGAWLTGAVVTWDDPDGRVLAALDAREGVDPRRPEAGPYFRRTLRVEVDGRQQEVLYYPSNPRHWRAVDLSVADEARVLLHATPRETDRDRGALYLVPLWRWLHRNGLADPYLDALMDVIHDHVDTLPEPVLQPGPYGMLDPLPASPSDGADR